MSKRTKPHSRSQPDPEQDDNLEIVVSIRMPVGLKKKIQAIAKANGTDISKLMRESAINYLTQMKKTGRRHFIDPSDPDSPLAGN